MRRVLGVAVVLTVLLSVQATYAGGPPFPVPPTGDYDLFLDKVKLRPGVKCDIHVKVFVNDQHPGMGKKGSIGKTVFAIPGWVHSAQSWDKYAEALFTHPFKGVRTSQVVAINLPGRGLSTPPTKISFGELLMDDNVTAILAALDRLPAHGIRPQEIIGFSQGGLLVQMVQQRLVDSGSSLFEEYGIFRAVLLGTGAGAPVDQGCTCGPGDACWMYFTDLFVTQGPKYDELGLHWDIPAELHPEWFYSNWYWEVHLGTLTTEELESYRAPGPLFDSMQSVGYKGYIPDYPGVQPYFPVPEISPGIFGLQSGTLLHVVGFEDDTVCPASFGEAVFDHVIGCPWWSRYTLVEAENDVHDRVHGLPMSNPSVIIEAMSEHGWFVW